MKLSSFIKIDRATFALVEHFHVLNQPLLVEWAVFNKKESSAFANRTIGVVSKYACGSGA